jgi:YjbE family integral membrane protein
VAGEFEAEAGGLGVDAVAAADGEGGFVLEGAALERGHHRIQPNEQEIGGARELDREAGIEHIGRGHAEVKEPRLRPDRLGKPGEKGDDVVARLLLDRCDAREIGRPNGGQAGRAFGADGARRLGGNIATIGHRLGGERLDLEPDAIAVFGRPDGSHLGARVAGHHAFELSLKRGYRGHGSQLQADGRPDNPASPQPWTPLMTWTALGPQLLALAQVVLIDLALAADNAVVVGLAVSGLAEADRRRALLLGTLAAAALRMVGGALALQLLAIIGLVLAGGILLLWVAWKMYRELRGRAAPAGHAAPPAKTLGQAMLQIALADISMSLDDVLAVAGVAENHLGVLVIGLALGVVLMAVAASLIARLLERYRWLAWGGWLMVLYVALKMIVEGAADLLAGMPHAP